MGQDKREIQSLKPTGAFFFGKPIPDNVANKIFLIESDTSKDITFKQFEKQAHALAQALLNDLHVENNDICAIFSESSIQFGVTLSACLLLGIKFTPVTPVNGPFELSQQLEDTGAKILFVDEDRVAVVEKMFQNPKNQAMFDNIRVVVMDDNNNIEYKPPFYTLDKLTLSYRKTSQQCTTIPYFANSLDSTLLIYYTSGSTGKPKGACHTHRSILSNMVEIACTDLILSHKHLPLMLTFPFGHVSGSLLFLNSLLNHTTTVIVNYANLPNMFDIIKRYQIGQIFGAMNVMSLLAKGKQPHHDISTVKIVLSSGSKLPVAVAEIMFNQYGIKVVESYGCTEFLWISFTRDYDQIPTNAGKLLPHIEFKTIDVSTGEILPQGQPGEICLRGDSCFQKYHLKPEETAKAIDSQGWFHTGDVGFLDQDGNLNITDRIKEIIKFKGWTIFPAEIECFLATHQAVLGSVVLGVQHKHYNQVPRAYVALKPEFKRITAQELENYVADNLGFQRRLRGGVKLIDQMRYTTMGKVDRQYFKCLCANEVLDFLEE